MSESIEPTIRFVRYIVILWFRFNLIKVEGACGARRITDQPFFREPGTGVWYQMFFEDTYFRTPEAALWG